MDIRQFSSVQRWASRVAPTTAQHYVYTMNQYYAWASENDEKFGVMNPDQLIEYQQNSVNQTRYEVLDSILDFANSKSGRHGYVSKKYKIMRSFFMHNRAELPRDPRTRFNTDRPRVTGTLTVEETRDMILSSDPVHQAIYICMFQAGMGQDEFLYWNEHGWADLEVHLRNDPQVIKINLPGRKTERNVRPYYTFIGGDSIEAIRKWLPHRPEEIIINGEYVQNPYIFTDQMKSQLTKAGLRKYWLRHLRKLGFVDPKKGEMHRSRTGKNLHELRDCFRTQWSKSGAKLEVAEYVMGHTIDPLEYDKSFRDVEFFKNEYLKAVPWLQLFSSGRPYGQVGEDEVMLLRRQVQELEVGRNNQVTTLKKEIEDLKKMFFESMKRTSS